MEKIRNGSRLLSKRETEVLQWLCSGKSNWEIGQIMSLSEYTVKNHVSQILKKLEANNRQHAVAKGIEMGLIDFE
ncbi:MAG: LuxR C-terminal-related transcriptional regulator [Candidatus Thiodiazotropha sp. (ex Dulcina madagascariensis)]|nr:LuxR C-terminal-related transcriptional regulator [Candidatus Thiodiazotropha sp. (ex Epidulcina cf. delphinae)]MCU7922945.1 LuxR C-terminal-related transcriptional regulator [Candidatus Thiodiazotropha sp. (ex Dulcina madagascariensis)]MCU7926088.1 LuxR C-terminal-related transcriptional regulator [Candidatus Thiodiazotropha sp. (ex Dulcina madagascariensis)]